MARAARYFDVMVQEIATGAEVERIDTVDGRQVGIAVDGLEGVWPNDQYRIVVRCHPVRE